MRPYTYVVKKESSAVQGSFLTLTPLSEWLAVNVFIVCLCIMDKAACLKTVTSPLQDELTKDVMACVTA